MNTWKSIRKLIKIPDSFPILIELFSLSTITLFDAGLQSHQWLPDEISEYLRSDKSIRFHTDYEMTFDRIAVALNNIK